MSEQNIRLDGAVTRDPSPGPGLVPLPVPKVHVVQSRSGPRPGSIPGPNRNAQFILHALRRWWKVATPAAVLLAGIAGAVVYLLFVPKYEAVALLEIEEQSPYVAFEPKQESRSKAYFQTQMELIRSRWVLAPSMEELLKPDPKDGRPSPHELQEQPDPVDWLSKQLKVVAPAESNLFRIIYAGPAAKDAARIVNTVQEQYMKLRALSEARRNERLINILAEEMRGRSDQVQTLRNKVRDLAKQMPGKDPFLAKDPLLVNTESQPAAKPSGPDSQGRLITIEYDMAMLRAKIEAAQQEQDLGGQTPGPQANAAAKTGQAGLSPQELAMRDAMADRFISESPEIKQHQAAILAKQSKLQEIEKIAAAGKENPTFVRLQAEIDREQQAIDKLQKEIRPRIQRETELAMIAKRTETENAATAKQHEELRKMQSELKAKEILKKLLDTEHKTEVQQVQQATGNTVEYIFARDELTRAEEVFKMIAHRQLALQTEQGAPARVVLRHAAAVPSAPIEVFPFKNIALAVLAGLGFPFALAIGWERLLRRVSNSQDLEQQAHLTVIGEIARLPVRTRIAQESAKLRIREDLRIFEESIDSLRTTLTLSDDLREMRLLAVTSAANHEGKTSIAAQLAISLARATGKKTLLIDGDMRSPDVHNVFNVPLTPGLAEVQSGESPLADGIITTWNELIHLLPAGKLKVNPHKLLGNGAWHSLLAQIPDTYRYVIIDTPPVLAASEALVLAKAADASLICVMRDVSRTDQVRKTSDRLLAAGSRVIGTVLNGVPTRQYAYRYGTYAHDGD
jgi:polysaccharide biosynthesis transport protein